jgi:tRNA A-37 threonylcarbamoyl transferase component Bud32
MTNHAILADESMVTLLQQLAAAPDAPVAPALVPGARLGRFTLTGQIGHGGFSVVFEALDTELGRKVAIKLMHRQRIANPGQIERFKTEAGILAQLSHENIVVLHDYGTIEGTPYLVLERLHGETLDARQEREKLALNEALRIAVAIARGVAQAHRSGIVHRDLKPSNVFLTTSGGVKVLDFGISKILESKEDTTRETLLIGTPRYMAPEQAAGRNRSVDARSDVFSLGTILYEMLTGKPAFLGESLAEVVYHVVHAAPNQLSTLAPEAPHALVAMVERALMKNPADRFSDMASFIKELERVGGDLASGVLFRDDTVALAAYRNVCIIVWRKPTTLAQLAQLRLVLQRLTQAWPRGIAFLTLFDRLMVPRLDADMRALFAGPTIGRDFSKQTLAGTYVFEMGGAASAFVRAVIAATNVFLRPTYPQSGHASLAEAIDWLAERVGDIDKAALASAIEEARAAIL